MPNIKGLLSLFGLVNRCWERLRAGVRAASGADANLENRRQPQTVVNSLDQFALSFCDHPFSQSKSGLNQPSSGGSGAGGITLYSGATALSGTQFFPIGGGSVPSNVEADVSSQAPAASWQSGKGGTGNRDAGWRRLRAGVRAAKYATQMALTDEHFHWFEGRPIWAEQFQHHTVAILRSATLHFTLLIYRHRAALSNRTSLAQFSIVQILILLLIAPILNGQSSSVGGGISGPTGGGGPTTNQNIRTIGASFGSFQSGATALSAAATACVPTYFSGTIQAVEIIGDVSGSATIDVKTVAHTSWTGTASVSSITAAAIPALSSAARYTDTTLTGWTKTVSAGTDVCFVMTSPTTVAGLSITLKVAAN